MNYLAHLYLAEDSPESLLGSMMGDFVKGAIGDRYPPKIKRGIELHRKIDSYTDSHPTTRASRNLYSPARRRFAGIIVDLCYDHFLYRHWSEFSDVKLDRFISRVYDILMAHRATLPARMEAMVPVMISQDWLGSYRDLTGVEKALSRLSKRVTNGDRLLGSIEEIKLHYRSLEANFLIFFPDLIRFVQNFLSTPSASLR
jgi:acyl carrier protein phosphodiesterase